MVQAVHVSGVPVTSVTSTSSAGKSAHGKSAHGKVEHKAERNTDSDRPFAKEAQRNRGKSKDKNGGLPELETGLPPGWQKGYDSLHRLYYYNSYLGESSWTPPPGSHLHPKHESAHRRGHSSSGGARRRQHRGRHVSRGGRDDGDGTSRSSVSAHSTSGGGGGDVKGHKGDKSKYDFTGRAARKDFLSFLGSMVKSARKAHDKAETMHRRAIAKRAKAFISGKMSSRDAHKALDSFWQSVDDSDEKKNRPAHHKVPPAVPTGVERDAGAASTSSHVQVHKSIHVLNHPRPRSPSSKPSADSASDGASSSHHEQEDKAKIVAAVSSSREVDHSGMSKEASTASTQTLAASPPPAPAPAPASRSSANAAADTRRGYLGLPTGKAAAVSIPRHKMTSDESHLKLQGYFSGISLILSPSRVLFLVRSVGGARAASWRWSREGANSGCRIESVACMQDF